MDEGSIPSGFWYTYDIGDLMSEIRTIFRLDPKQLAAVQRQAGSVLSVNSNTTPLEAGVQLGMARVLRVLQEGFTVESINQNTNDG